MTTPESIERSEILLSDPLLSSSETPERNINRNNRLRNEQFHETQPNSSNAYPFSNLSSNESVQNTMNTDSQTIPNLNVNNTIDNSSFTSFAQQNQLISSPHLTQLQQYYQSHYQQQQLYNQQFQQLHRSSNQLLTLHDNVTRQNQSSSHLSSTPLGTNSSNNVHQSPQQTTTDSINLKKFSENKLQKQQSSDKMIPFDSTCPYGCCNTPNIPEHLFMNGLVKGNHYDVIIKAFGKKYKLHKLFLDRSPYFKSLFSWSKNLISELKNSDSGSDSDSDSSEFQSDYRKVYDLPLEEDHNGILSTYKQKSFELAISRLYGAINLKEEYKIPYNMIEIGQYLALSDIVCTATEFIVKNMEMQNLADDLRFAITSDYGSASKRIIENGKGILCTDGWEQGPESWDGIPTTIAASVLGEDYFFVPTEWDRCIFIIKLIERRLESNNFEDENENVMPLKKVLNEKIHYCHIPPFQLQELEGLVDINGENYIEPHVLHSALWQSVQLETLISRAKDSPYLDSVVSSPTIPSNNHKWFKVPSKDETLSGLPKELDNLLSQSLSTLAINQLNSDDSKTTQGEENSFNTNNDKMFIWTKIPPFRFSISFANVSELSTDKRVYGKTFWYAGSYWNLYLQKSHIQSKNSYQVGVYLHRAHNRSSNSSSKSGLINPDIYSTNVNYRSLPKSYGHKQKLNSYETIPVERKDKMSSTRISDSTIDNLGMNILDLSISEDNMTSDNNSGKINSKFSSNANNSNYEDHRSAIKVYFIIFTPSRRSMPTITSFLSVPNDFSKSQSWGWKSNNMCVFNEDGTFAEGQDSNLKFMILLGNV